jgi:GPI mannosyltransferase 1 subunit M
VVHLRLYPIIYLPAMLLYLLPPIPKNPLELLCIKYIKDSFHDKHFNRLLTFLFTFCTTLLLLTLISYAFEGHSFLQESIYHHFGRQDHRHNFSAYYFMYYLQKSDMNNSFDTTITSTLLPFTLQIFLLLSISIKFSQHQLPLCLLLLTLVFVTWNKVITAQYFLWYISLLPLALSTNSLLQNKRILITTTGFWMTSIAYWLYRAYWLEIHGENEYRAVWIASLLCLFTHCIFIMVIAYAGKNKNNA